MKNYSSALFVLMVFGILFVPVSQLFGLNESKVSTIAIQNELKPCQNQHTSSTVSSCSSTASMYWVQTHSDLVLNPLRLMFAGLLSFIFLFSYRNAPMAKPFRPPIAFSLAS